MRLTRYQFFALGVLVLAIFGPVAFTQDFGKGKGSSRMQSPEDTFKQYSGGKDVIVVSEVTVPERMSRWVSTEQLREQMNTFLQKKGITNGQMTLEVYKEYTEDQRRVMMEKFQKGDFGKKTEKSGSAPPGGDTKSETKTEDADARTREFFKRLDADGDGYLTNEELQKVGRWGERLLADFDKHDSNKDKKIDVNEYLEYSKARAAEREQGKGEKDKSGKGFGGWEQDGEKAKVEEDKRPVVYRIGNLPKELAKSAPWFEESDRDKDGQVGLYEWKAAGREVREFLAMDANGDGFVTVEELLRFQKAQAARKDDGKSQASLPGQGTPTWGNKGKGTWGTKDAGKGDFKSKFSDFGKKGKRGK